MEFQKFKKIVDLLESFDKKGDLIRTAGVDLYEYTENLETVVDLLLTNYYGEDAKGWFDWFIYECDFGNKIMEATDKDGNLICQNLEELHKEMESCRKTFLKNQKPKRGDKVYIALNDYPDFLDKKTVDYDYQYINDNLAQIGIVTTVENGYLGVTFDNGGYVSGPRKYFRKHVEPRKPTSTTNTSIADTIFGDIFRWGKLYNTDEEFEADLLAKSKPVDCVFTEPIVEAGSDEITKLDMAKFADWLMRNTYQSEYTYYLSRNNKEKSPKKLVKIFLKEKNEIYE